MVQRVKQASRIMIKLSWETLKGQYDHGFDFPFIESLVDKIITLVKKQKKQVVIVVGAGNIFRWIEGARKGMNQAIADYMGILATVMNGLALGEAFETAGQPAKVMTSLEVPKIVEWFMFKKAMDYLDTGHVLICVWWTGNPYFTTDTCAVQKAVELQCDMMVKATKVDGVYDKDPMKHTDAVKFQTLTLKKANELGLNIMDHSAIAMAMDNKLPLYVCKVSDLQLLGEEDIGSYVAD